MALDREENLALEHGTGECDSALVCTFTCLAPTQPIQFNKISKKRKENKNHACSIFDSTADLNTH